VLLNPLYTARYLMMAGGVIRFIPPPRAILNGEPFWEFLHRAGVPTAVVRFRFTYPATGHAEIVVSDWVGRDQWQSMGVLRPDVPNAVTPQQLGAELAAPFSAQMGPDEALLSQLLPATNAGPPADVVTDPAVALRWAADIDQRTFDVSELILKKDPARSVLAIYLDGFDLVAHAFWQYRFPEDFRDNKPASADVERLKPVIDRYLRYLDARLGRLLALYTTAPDVLIVSDHGHGAATTAETTWRGWHTTPGMFLLSGPQVPSSPERVRVSYYDVFPTVLHLKQLEKPAALRGSSVLQR
jgi:predicted AlkP superfamily phosphohydrolase/phosphomutase